MTEFSAFPGAGGAVDLTISGKNDAHLQPFVAMNTAAAAAAAAAARTNAAPQLTFVIE